MHLGQNHCVIKTSDVSSDLKDLPGVEVVDAHR